MWNKTRLSTLFGVEYPIIQAPMAGGPTTPELVSEVSNEGGLGIIGAGYFTAEKLTSSIQEVKKRTNKPFGVNLFVVKEQFVSETDLRKSFESLGPFREKLKLPDELPEIKTSLGITELIDIVIHEEVPICSFTFGIPDKEIITRLKKHNIIVVGTATTVEEAKAVEEAGMDAVVAQGSEAGGHRATFIGHSNNGLIGTMALVPQVKDYVHIPVIASGGIMDGRGFAAASMLGAEGVQMGTAFLTTKESGANEFHKRAVLTSTEEQTVITTAFSGKAARGINNYFIHQLTGEGVLIAPYPIQNSLTKPIRSEAMKQGDTRFMSLWSGQGSRMSENTTVKELFGKLVSDINGLLN
ncbi:nitronate monooxygenase [Pseudalkalibacillus sp. SCS-8]|uniref:NAD(P)H-dependent flavin oxidoreductase n=1 Tax=Pseudalkalibacillus nanhaiensis TaxID=3115291 RepID=UPI0032DBA4AD